VPLKVQVSGKTDVGLVRPGNEDYLLIDREHNVFAVCDGMGGHKAGEVASQTAAETIQAVFAEFRDEVRADPDLDLDQPVPSRGELLLKGIRLANRAIFNHASKDPDRSGMGTTVVALALEDDIMSIAHVGDSRAYRLDEDRLVPLTSDHSWVAEMKKRQEISDEEAVNMVGKNVITRALGVRENVEVDYRLMKVEPGQIYILCSDGLCGFVPDDEIFPVAYAARKSTDHLVKDLIQLANDRGGQDNVTVIALQIQDVGESNYDEMEAFTLPAESKELQANEDTWINRLDAAGGDGDKEEDESGEEEGGSRMLLGLIFGAFVIIAVVIIWLTVGQ
jgi:protein phosphatase